MARKDENKAQDLETAGAARMEDVNTGTGTETPDSETVSPNKRETEDASELERLRVELAEARTRNAELESRLAGRAPQASPVPALPKSALRVAVFCNMPNGISFRLPDGRKLTFKGYPVSRLVGPDGEALPAGRFGVTPNVLAEDWAYIQARYGQCSYFDPANPLLFAAASVAEGQAIARDLRSTRHGLEQIDVRGDKTVNTRPVRREGEE